MKTRQAQRALSVSADERAARADKAAADQSAWADKLEQEVRDYDKRITGEGDDGTPAIERVADQLDERANLLSQAADSQRAAARFEAEGNTEAAARATQASVTSLSQADAIQPSYSAVDPTLLNSAGITTGRRAIDDDPEPGSETIDPGSAARIRRRRFRFGLHRRDRSAQPVRRPGRHGHRRDRRVPDRSQRHR